MKQNGSNNRHTPRSSPVMLVCMYPCPDAFTNNITVSPDREVAHVKF